jgi:hypothetical protein
MKNLIKKAKKIIAGAGLVALAAATNVAEAKGSDNKEHQKAEQVKWELQEKENKALCAKLPNSRYVLPTREEFLKQGINPEFLDTMHGTCYATIKEPTWTEQIESDISLRLEAPADVMTFIKDTDGSLRVQAFANENNDSEMIITFTNAKSCLSSCPANTRASINPDAESDCECEPVENKKPVSSLKQANDKKAAMVQSMLYVNGR